MGHPAFELDWNLVRTFVAVAQAGSLAAGARKLGITHPTAARHVQALEDDLGLALFSRTAKGLVLNDLGDELLDCAEQMHRSALTFRTTKDRLSAQPVSHVTISVTGVLAELLPQVMLAQLTDDTAVTVDMVVTDDLLNLLEHDADIAVRHVRPTQQELLCRHVGSLPMGLYATGDYVERFGELRQDTLLTHRFIDGLQAGHLQACAAKRGIAIEPRQMALRSDSVACQRAAVDAGCGIAAFPKWMGQRYTHWVEMAGPQDVMDMEVWLVARPGVRDTGPLKKLFKDLGCALQDRLQVPS